jgi:hypothetical protein
MSDQCTIDREGDRHADMCQVWHSEVGDEWVRQKTMIRKVFVSKLANAEGKEVCRIYKRGPTGHFTDVDVEQVILPGFQGHVFFPSEQGGLTRKVVLETIELPSGERSHFYVHVEWWNGGADAPDHLSVYALAEENRKAHEYQKKIVNKIEKAHQHEKQPAELVD